jgi:hypothetical protein
MMGRVAVAFIVAGSIWFWVVTLWVVKLQRVAFTMVMSVGALVWAVGNVCWWAGWPFNRVVPW